MMDPWMDFTRVFSESALLRAEEMRQYDSALYVRSVSHNLMTQAAVLSNWIYDEKLDDKGLSSAAPGCRLLHKTEACTAADCTTSVNLQFATVLDEALKCIFVVFRGTATAMDALVDIHTMGHGLLDPNHNAIGIKVHSGVHTLLNNERPRWVPMLTDLFKGAYESGTTLIMTGHSLGGAVAMELLLYLLLLKEEMVDQQLKGALAIPEQLDARVLAFGAPMPVQFYTPEKHHDGAPDYVEQRRRIEDDLQRRCLNFVHGNDVVPRLPGHLDYLFNDGKRLGKLLQQKAPLWLPGAGYYAERWLAGFVENFKSECSRYHPLGKIVHLANFCMQEISYEELKNFDNEYENDCIDNHLMQRYSEQLQDPCIIYATVRGPDLIASAASVAFSPDMQVYRSIRRVVSGGSDGRISIWNAATGALVRHFSTHHTDAVTCVVFSLDGRHVVSGSRDNSAMLWDPDEGCAVRTFTGHADQVNSVAISPDSQKLVSGSNDATVRIWDVNTGECLFSLSEGWRAASVTAVAFSPNGAQALAANTNGKIKVWDAADGSLVRRFKGHSHAVTAVAYSPDGQTIVSGGSSGNVRLWHGDAGKAAVAREWSVSNQTTNMILAGHTAAVTSLVFAPSGEHLVSASRDATIRIWGRDRGVWKEERILRGHAGPVGSAGFSPSGLQLVSCSEDTTIKLWQLPRARLQ